MNRTVISVLIVSLLFASESLLAKINISSQSIMDSAIQNACDSKFDDEQDILKCVAQSYKPSESITLNYSSAKVYEVEFSGFGTNLVLTPKENGKTLIIEIDGYYIYASKIYNIDTCCNPNAPIIILERLYTRNNMMSDCNPCSTSSELWVYRLASPDSQPLVISTSPDFTNSTAFGSLLSNDINYNWDSLKWDEGGSRFSVNAYIPGPPNGRANVRFELGLENNVWITRIFSN